MMHESGGSGGVRFDLDIDRIATVWRDSPGTSVNTLSAATWDELEVALACEYRIAADDPRIEVGLPETTLGLVNRLVAHDDLLDVAKQTGLAAPASRVIDIVETGLAGGHNVAMAAERSGLVALRGSPAANHLLGMFFARIAAKKRAVAGE